MSRFYKTAIPKFERGIMHETPWELGAQVLQKKDKEVDSLFANAELLEGSTANMNYLAFEKDKAAQIQDQYSAKVDELVTKIQEDPMNAAKYEPALRGLKRDIQKNRMRGDWYNMEQRYSSAQKWMEDNKGMKKSDPDNYNTALNKFMTDLEAGVAEDPEAEWSGFDLVSRPDIMTDDVRKRMKEIKANVRANPGQYFNTEETSVTPQRVAAVAMEELMNDQLLPYLRQQKKILGDEEFERRGYNEPMFKDGQINHKNPFAGQISAAAGTYGYNEMKITGSNPFTLAKYKHDLDMVKSKYEYDLTKDPNLIPTIQSTHKLYSAEQINETYTDFYLPIKAKIENEEDPFKNMDKHDIALYERFDGLMSSAKAQSGITQDVMEDVLTVNSYQQKYERALKENGGDAQQARFDAGMESMEIGTGRNAGVPRIIRNQDYYSAKDRVTQAGDKAETFNNVLSDRSIISIPTVPVKSIDKNSSPLAKMYANEANYLLGNSGYQVYNGDYLPYNIDELNSVRNTSFEGGDFISQILERNSDITSPLEIFEGGTLRHKRAGKVYYIGKIKPALIEGLDQSSVPPNGKIIIEAPNNITKTDQYVMEEYQSSPDMIDMFKYGGDGHYITATDIMNAAISDFQNTGREFFPVDIEGAGQTLEIKNVPDLGYQAYLTDENGNRELADELETLDNQGNPITIPINNDKGAMISLIIALQKEVEQNKKITFE